MKAEQSHNSINKCKDDMRTRGQADSGMGQHIASNALKCAQEKLRCDCTKGGKSRGRRLERRQREETGHEACMSFGMNEVKFTVVHSLSKTKSLSS